MVWDRGARVLIWAVRWAYPHTYIHTTNENNQTNKPRTHAGLGAHLQEELLEHRGGLAAQARVHVLARVGDVPDSSVG